MECSICFDSLAGGAFSTNCGHIFCECIIDYIETSVGGNCPVCNQSLTTSQIHKIFLPQSRASIGGGSNSFNADDGGFNNAIVQSLVHDLAVEKKSTQEKLLEMQKLMETMTITFTEIDTRHDKIVQENQQLKQELGELKTKVKNLEEVVKKIKPAEKPNRLMVEDLNDAVNQYVENEFKNAIGTASSLKSK